MSTATKAGADLGALVEQDRVHSSIYTDPAIFEEEIARIFHQGWVYIGHEAEAPEPGDFVTSHIGRQPVILTRGDDGAVHVLMNRCTHRGLTVCQEACGSAKYFQCAYHGWTFRNSGELLAVPYPAGYGPSFRKEDHPLARPPRVDRYRGFVFASLRSEGEPFEEYLTAPVREQIDLAMDLSPAGEFECPKGRTRFRYRGNWKFVLENTADAYHINFLHRSFLDVLGARVAKASPNGKAPDFDGMSDDDSAARNVSLGHGHTLMDMRPHHREQTTSRDAIINRSGSGEYLDALVAAHGKERADELVVAGGTHMGLWPNASVLAVVIRRIHPIAVDETEIILTPTLLKGVPDSVNQARLRGIEMFFPPSGLGGTDDSETFERQQLGLMADVDPWVLIARGLDREVVQADGTVASNVTDETNARGIYRQWRSAMADE